MSLSVFHLQLFMKSFKCHLEGYSYSNSLEDIDSLMKGEAYFGFCHTHCHFCHLNFFLLRGGNLIYKNL